MRLSKTDKKHWYAGNIRAKVSTFSAFGGQNVLIRFEWNDTTRANFPRSELVALVRARATETAFTSPAGRLRSSQFKLSVFISANLQLICVPHMKISKLLA